MRAIELSGQYGECDPASEAGARDLRRHPSSRAHIGLRLNQPPQSTADRPRAYSLAPRCVLVLLVTALLIAGVSCSSLSVSALIPVCCAYVPGAREEDIGGVATVRPGDAR